MQKIKEFVFKQLIKFKTMKKFLARMLKRIINILFLQYLSEGSKFQSIFNEVKVVADKTVDVYTDDDKENGKQLEELLKERAIPFGLAGLDTLQTIIETDKVNNDKQMIILDSIEIIRMYVQEIEAEKKLKAAQ